MKTTKLKSATVSIHDLVLIEEADPAEAKYIIPGATVWLRSGYPPFKVEATHNGKATVSWDNQKITLPIPCFSPDPRPITPAHSVT